jgi:hypothetical protein
LPPVEKNEKTASVFVQVLHFFVDSRRLAELPCENERIDRVPHEARSLGMTRKHHL